MARTAQLDLPLVLPAQAQKHVTVNEALARLDAVAQLRLESTVLTMPPGAPAEGSAYLVPAGADGDWSGNGGKVAIRSNGGWVFATPRAGWRAWDAGSGAFRTCYGAGWIADAVAVSAGGAGTRLSVVEFDHAITAGTSNLTAVAIPARAQVIGVTGRVLAGLTGAGLTGWRVGVAGADNRYGSGLGIAANSYLQGLSGSPVTYYAETPLLLSAEGGSFGSGTVRLALHLIELEPPQAV
jgi:hypothetical protein